MNAKGSGIRISYRDFAEIIEEMPRTPVPGCGDSDGLALHVESVLLSGKAEHRCLKPGLKIMVADFFLNQQLEISGEFSQTVFALTLTIDGSWNGAVTDHQGRTAELDVNPGLNTATVGPPQQYSLRLKGSQFHRAVRVEITDPFLSEMFAGIEIEDTRLAQRIFAPATSRRVLIRKNLSPALKSIAHRVIRYPMDAVARRLLLEGKVLEILAHQVEIIADIAPGSRMIPNSGDLECLQKARSILEDEFSNPPSLFGLARRVGLNDFKLKRGFKEIFGTTVFGYVRKLRMDKARALLESGDLNVTEAALDAGYSSLGHFAAAFKKCFGILPNQCRNARRASLVSRKRRW